MFNIIESYIGKIVFKTIMITLFLLISLSGIIKFIEQLRIIGQGQYSVFSASLCTILDIPKDIELFIPISLLLGTLLSLSILSIHNELIVMQALGLTRLQIVKAIIKTIIPLMVIVFIIGEKISPVGDSFIHNYHNKIIGNNPVVSIKNNLWIKDNMNFIFIEKVIKDDELLGIYIYNFNQQKYLQSLTYAKKAIYDKKKWMLLKVRQFDLSNQQINNKDFIKIDWTTNLTPNQLSIMTRKPNSLSIMELYNYITFLQQNKQKYDFYQFKMWSKIFAPLSMLSMNLIALSLFFMQPCDFSIKIRITNSIGIGFIFYLFNQLFGSFSIILHILPLLGASLPSFIGLLVSIYILIKN